MSSRLKRRLFIAVAVMAVFTAFFSPMEALAQDDYYYENFHWTYGGKQWSWSLSVAKSLYESYKSVPVSARTRNGPGGYGFLTTTKDPYLQMVADKLHEVSSEEGYGSYDEVSFVLAFVQSLPYTSDSVTTGYDEYPRFPLETLVDDGGDCEDTAVLFATLTILLGYGTVYIEPPNHLAVGVAGSGLPGYCWTYKDKTYFYCETTGDNWKIGDLPSEYEGVREYSYTINCANQYDPSSGGYNPLVDGSLFNPSGLGTLALLLLELSGALVFILYYTKFRKTAG